jgi:allantoinase
MPDFDCIIRGGSVVTGAGPRLLDIAVSGEKIAAVGPDIKGSSTESLDAAGLQVFPGVIDAHVHFNEPGRAEWEGIETGSRALAAGGGTVFVDMPLNAHPPTIDPDAFAQKLAAAQRSSVTDFALWGGLVPGNIKQMEPLADCGVVGFKAFLSNSGIEDFERADVRTLKEGMKKAAGLRLPVAVHAESEPMTSALAKQKMAANLTSVRDYLESRPMESELEAISVALELAGETGCALHIVHVSSGEGVRLIAEAKKFGVDVTCETCPHYLVLTDEDMERLGAIAKCAPPLRSRNAQDQLWEQLAAGRIDTIGSDHSPSPPEMKVDSNFFQVWGGISGVQHLLPLLLTAGGQRNFSLEAWSKMVSFNPAKRFRIEGNKGEIASGKDADFALVRLGESRIIQTGDLFYRHRQTPYAGRKLTAQVVRTIVRGRTIFNEGHFPTAAGGRFQRPKIL